MVTFNSSSVKLPVRFRASAPIFKVFLFSFFLCFSLCVSGHALLLADGLQYSFDSFDSYFVPTSSSSIGISISPSSAIHSSGSVSSSSSSRQVFVGVPSGSISGSTSTTNSSGLVSTNALDLSDSAFQYLKLEFYLPFYSAASDLLYSSIVGFFVAGSNSIQLSSFTPSYSSSSNSYNLSYTMYHSAVTDYSIVPDSTGVHYFVNVAFDRGYRFGGFFLNISRPRDYVSGNYSVDLTKFKFTLSNSIFTLPPSGSSGSADLSPVIHDIAALSAQMSSEFLAVNNRISQAETSISNSISDQTSALQSSIADGADTVVDGVNDHFDSWDDELQSAYSSEAAGVITDTNQAVDDMHQFEEDRIDDADQALVDVGLESYQVPTEVSASFTEIGTLFRLLFNSFPFVSSLIVFSCTFGIAFVLIGRKSRGS